MSEATQHDPSTTVAGADDLVVVVPIEKADSRWDSVLSEIYATEWTESGAKVIRYPIDLKALLDASIMSPFHRRCLKFKRTAVIGNGYTLADDPAGENSQALQEVRNVLSDEALTAFVDDRYLFGNAYLERESNVYGRVVRLHHVRANTVWKKAKGGWTQRVVDPDTNRPHYRDIAQAKLLHSREYSPLSDHYGVPDYLPALLPVALSYEADDFHRKFYANGAHAGLVLLLKGAKNLSPEQRKDIETKFREAKGPGHFKSIFMYFRDTDVELEIKGVAKETPVRDDYPEITKSTREKILSAHGLPPRLMSIILDAKSGAMQGKVSEELELFNLSLVEPEQLALEQFLNPHLPHRIKFRPFLLSRTQAQENPEPAEVSEEEPEEGEQ